MRDLREWWQHVLAMMFGTAKVWWHQLPLLLGVSSLGYLGLQAALVVAPFISGSRAWVAVAVLAFGLVLQLSTTIICLRLLGRELNINRLLPEGSVHDDREQSAAHLIAITLLPFLGIYATFGQVQQVINSSMANEVVIRGLGERGVMNTLNPSTPRQIWILLAVVGGAYVVRRVIDLLHEKTGFRPLGLLAAMIEAFFMLVFLYGGTALLRKLKLWLLERRFTGWFSELHEGWRTSASKVSALIPEAVAWLWRTALEVVWPLFKASLAQPLLWLAVAALVYGSHVLSLAEVWRKGEPLSVHLDHQRTISLKRRAQRDQSQGSNLGRRAWLEFQEAFLSDVDDKYLPTLQSLRLVLRTGAPFLAAYVLCYAVIDTVERLLGDFIYAQLGAQNDTYWVSWLQVINVVAISVAQSLKFALLAVAFTRTLQTFQRSADATTVAASASRAVADAEVDLAPATVRGSA